MYKLLLVSDQPSVLNAFGEIKDWGLMGYKQPHVRNDFSGAVECLEKHHADGIVIGLENSEEEQKLLSYLRDEMPALSIVKAGHTPDQVRFYLSELGILLNRLRADFSNDNFNEEDMLRLCRHDFFRKLISGRFTKEEDLRRNLNLLRSKMDPDRPCVLVHLAQPDSVDQLSGRWHYGADRLEYALRQALGSELKGLWILPSVQEDERVLLLYCPMSGQEDAVSGDSMTSLVTSHTASCIEHAREFLGVNFTIRGLNVLPSLMAFCDQNRLDG